MAVPGLIFAGIYKNSVYENSMGYVRGVRNL